MQEELPPQEAIPQPNTTPHKNFLLKRRGLKLFLISIFFILVTFSLVGGGNPFTDLACITKQASPLAGFNIGACPKQMGAGVRLVQMCNLLINNQAKGICRGAYAVKHNNLGMCLELSSGDMTQQPLCLENLAINNKDITICEKATINPPGKTSPEILAFTIETCRNYYNYHYRAEKKVE